MRVLIWTLNVYIRNKTWINSEVKKKIFENKEHIQKSKIHSVCSCGTVTYYATLFTLPCTCHWFDLAFAVRFWRLTYYIGRDKQKRTFENVQNVRIHIILRMRKVSYGPLLSIVSFYSIQWLTADSEGPDQNAHPCSLIWAFAFRTCPESILSDDVARMAAALITVPSSICFRGLFPDYCCLCSIQSWSNL